MIIGSKLLFFFTQIHLLFDNLSFNRFLAMIIASGFVFYGGLFGSIAFLKVYSIKQKLFKEYIFDLVTPCFCLFHIFGRMGCFLAGCCYGKDLKNPYILFGMSINKVPTQLIEMGCELIILVILLVCEKQIRKNKLLLPIYLILYSLCRFTLEFYRGDIVRGIYYGLSTSQWISIGIWIYFGILLIRSKFIQFNQTKVFNE